MCASTRSVFADHPPVQDPDAFGLTVLFFHQPDPVLHRGHVGSVAGKDFIADGQPFGRDHQTEIHLFAVRNAGPAS